MLYNSVLDLIGNTPMLYLKKLSDKYKTNIYLKLEKYNYTYSIKDRAVKQMLLALLKENKINKETKIIEASSGNTGISLAAMCSFLSLKCIIVMPKNTNSERIKMIKAYGANIVFSDENKKMKGAIKKAKDISKKIPNSYFINQFSNVDNINAHINTASEIINDLPNLDALFLSYGSYGTIIGCSKALKEYNKHIKIHPVVLDCKNHNITGIYSNYKSKYYNNKIMDKTIKVSENEVFNMIFEIAVTEGVFLGLSSACNLCGAIKNINGLKNIVVICPDGGERYLDNQYLYINQDYSSEKIKLDVNELFENMFFLNQNFTYFSNKYNISVKQLNKIKNVLIEDAKFISKYDPSSNDYMFVIKTYNSFFAIFLYRIAHFIYKSNQYIAKIISEYAHSKTGIDIHPQAIIGHPFSIDHGSGVVIGQTCKIGNYVRLYHNVTLGAVSINKDTRKDVKRHPTIKDNVVIYSNVTILGGKTIVGNNVIIGSGITLFDSVDDNTIVYLKDNKIIHRKRNL